MGGAGRFFKISLEQRKPRPEMSSLVDHSDKKSRSAKSANVSIDAVTSASMTVALPTLKTGAIVQ